MKKIVFVFIVLTTSCMIIPKNKTVVPPSKMEVKGGRLQVNGTVGYHKATRTVFDDGHVEIICSGEGVNICPNLPKAEGVPEIIKSLIRQGEICGEFTFEKLSIRWYDGTINKDDIEEYIFITTPIK